MKMKILTLFFSILSTILQAQVGLNFKGESSTVGDRITTTFVGPTGSSARTIEFWCRTDVTNGAGVIQYDIANFGGSVSTTARLSIKVQVPGYSTGEAIVRVESGTTGFNGLIPVNGGAWHHVAVTYDVTANPQCQIYVDGVADVAQNITLNTGSTAMSIGGRSGGTFYFNGDLDELRIWDVARTQPEIQNNMNDEFCSVLLPNLKAYYKFNEGVPNGTNTALPNTGIVNEIGSTTNTLVGFAKNGTESNWSVGTVNSASTTASVTASSCSNYTAPSGAIYTSSGVYNDIIPNTVGCDSIITINYTNLATGSTQTITTCDSYTWPLNSTNYTSSGLYTHTIVGGNAAGCDSIVTLNLTINPNPVSTIVENGDNTISSATSSVSYQWLDCNNSNAPMAGEINQLFVPAGSGSYSVEVTTPFGCIDTSTCFNFTAAVIENVAMNFDGMDDYIETDFQSISGNNPITVEAYIKTSATSGENIISTWGTDAYNGGRFTFRVNTNGTTGVLRVEIKGGGFNGTINVSDNVWHHVAVTYDPAATTKYSLYVDGVLDVSNNIAQTLNIGTTQPLLIGRRIVQSFGGYFNGTMDELRVWNVVRSQAELVADMDEEYCTLPTGLVSYFNFNEGVANDDNTAISDVVDLTTTNTIGTLMSFANIGLTSNFVFSPNLIDGMQLGYVDTESACEAYTWSENTTEYTTSGNYFVRLTDVSGCDSLVRLNLTINQPTTSSETLSVCAPYTWAQTGVTYPTTGMYSDTIPNAAGCDSVIVLNLTVGAPTTSTQIETACNSYEWPINSQLYTTSGMYTATIVNASGCDSTITLDLTVNNETFATETVTFCNDYVWPLNSETYTMDGSYTDTIPNAAGCDSIVTLDLTIVPLTVVATDNGDATLTANVSGMAYQWIDCATNTAISGETAQTFAPTVNGVYAVIIDNGDCSDTSACIFIGNVGVEDISMNSVKFYPNPVVNELTIQFNGSETGTIHVTDIRGSIIATTYVNAETATNISLANQPSGVYYVVIATTNHTSTHKIINE